MKRTFAWFACLLLCACSCGKKPAPPAPGVADEARTTPHREPWNVVFVLADALRASNLATYGYPRDLTPTISELADEGIVFEQHFAGASYTRLSIGQIFTGLFFAPPLMSKHFSDDAEIEISADTLLLPTAFKAAGYQTTLVSAHPWFDASPAAASFDVQHVVLTEQKGQAPFAELLPHALEALARAKTDTRPFFLYLHALDTHLPHDESHPFNDHRGTSEALARYDAYDGVIRYTDHHIGKVVLELERLGLSDSTLVVFTSDHGDEFGELGDHWWNEAHGSNVRRAATHVPLIMRLPSSHRHWGRYKDASSHLDLAVTILSLAVPGFDRSPFVIEGHDLSERLLQERYEATSRAVFSRNANRYTAVRRGDLPNIDVVYDAWTDRVTTYTHEYGATNFPFPKAIQPTGKVRDVAVAMHQIMHDPPGVHFRAPQPTNTEPAVVRRAIDRVVRSETDNSPTYGETNDGAWTIRAGRYIRAHPTEHPGRLTFRVGNVHAGRYKLSLVPHPSGIERKDTFRMTVTVHGKKRSVTQLAPTRLTQGQLLELGTHELPRDAMLTLDVPRGGVTLAGYEYARVDAPAAALKDAPIVDERIERQLRALGYVE